MKKPLDLKILLTLLLIPAFAAAQTGYPAAKPPRDIGMQITRTAAGLGLTLDAGSAAVPKASEPAPPEGNSMPLGQKWGYLIIAYHTICAQLADSGLLPWNDGAAGFDKISEAILAAVADTRYPPRRAGQPSLLSEEGYLREMEALTGTRFTSGNTSEFLADGPEAFAVKNRLIREAKKSIYITSYALYDDVTGNETVAMLLAKKKEGVDIKVMVDDKMANAFGGKLLKKMKAAGIGVVRYVDLDRGHDYLHIKMMLVDGQYSVIGGMNFGDPYSHKGNGLKWRDTDILYTGPSVLDSERIFAELWNARVKTAAEKVPAPRARDTAGGPARIAVLYQNPPTLNPVIFSSVIKAIYGATRRVNIENAYIVAIPALTRAIADARARGVEVNVLTNSKESIDSDGKAMADVILQSMKVFAAAGASVYLKRGQTLHSKFMTVDGVFCSVGSYNLHPRSERYDTELNINLLDQAEIARIDAVFEEDIAKARQFTEQEKNQNKPGWLSRIAGRFFFAQLSAGK